MPWLRQIDLETWHSTMVDLSAEQTHSSASYRFIAHGRRWALEAMPGATEGTWVNGQRVGQHELQPGDVLGARGDCAIFLNDKPSSNPELERAIDAAPFDPNRVKVWADWLLEQGDPLGEHLADTTAHDSALEGLDLQVRSGQLELEWYHGLIRAARLRCVDDTTWSQPALTARLVNLRVARWLERLTVDVCPWVTPTANRIHSAISGLSRGLVRGPALPALAALSFGYVTGEFESTPFQRSLEANLRKQFKKLEPHPLLARARHAWLEVQVPEALDFYAPTMIDQRLSLDAGLWVGAATPGQWRALAPGVPRTTVAQSFVVTQEAPHWCLLPLEEGLELNGRVARPTRLLPGDCIVDSRGVQYRFVVAS